MADTIHVYFGAQTGATEYEYTVIPDDDIVRMHQEAKLFNGTLCLGSTVCRVFEIDILKSAFTGDIGYDPPYYLPGRVKITRKTETDGVSEEYDYAYMNVDSVDDENRNFYSYVLVDDMVRLNRTVTNLLSAVRKIGDGLHYISSVCGVTVNWSNLPDEIARISFAGVPFSPFTARDFVSWVAELWGGFAYADADGEIKFARFVTTGRGFTKDLSKCEDFRIGKKITVTNVRYENGQTNEYYPISEGTSLYLNPSNPFLKVPYLYVFQSVEYLPLLQRYRIQSIRYIFERLVDNSNLPQSGSSYDTFSFYTFSTTKCETETDNCHGIDQVGCLGSYVLYDGEGSISERYDVLGQIDWDYNGGWNGGYSIDINTDDQTETDLVSNSNYQLANDLSNLSDTVGNKVSSDYIIKAINDSTETVLIDGSRIDLSSASLVTGVKGSAETDYRTGDIEISASDIGVEDGAEVNVQSDWDETDTTSDAYIQNKPTIPTATSDLTNDSDFVSDASYVHTDSNFTTTLKNKLNAMVETEHYRLGGNASVTFNISSGGYMAGILAYRYSANRTGAWFLVEQYTTNVTVIGTAGSITVTKVSGREFTVANSSASGVTLIAIGGTFS